MIHCNTWSWISTNQCTSEQRLTHTPHRNVPSPIFMLHTESQLVANFLSVYCPQREHSSSEFTAWHECIVSLLYSVVTGSHFLQQMASKTGGYDCKFVEIPSNKLVCQICLHVAWVHTKWHAVRGSTAKLAWMNTKSTPRLAQTARELERTLLIKEVSRI